MTEATLARAQAGDGEAFRELVDPYRGELLAHCYRTLGSFHDAEDVFQEALLAAWRAIGQFDGRSLRAWLYRITTNRCLNFLRSESRQKPGMTRGSRSRCRSWLACSICHPSSERSWCSGDVLGFPAAEVADILDTTAAAVNSALVRARAGLRPDRDLHDVPLPKSPAEAAVVDRFVDALQSFDLDPLVSLLTEDARLTMPPEPIQHLGPLAVAGFLESHLGGQELRLIPTRANNQPALAMYLPDPCAPIWRASSLVVLTLRGDRVLRAHPLRRTRAARPLRLPPHAAKRLTLPCSG